MITTLTQCSPAELPALVSLVDDEFVHGRGRQASLGRRYPGLLSENNLDNLYLARSGSEPCGTVAVKRFRWLAGGGEWQGAMVGLVCTASNYRNQGVASQLLASITARLHETETDFAVLWTTIPEFYERLGWRLRDHGLFGEDGQQSGRSTQLGPVDDRLEVDRFAWLEDVRCRWLSQRVCREPIDYLSIPIPALTVRCFTVPEIGEGYALVGDMNTTGYVYELVGDPATFGAIWSKLKCHYQTIYTNDRRGSPSERWLQRETSIKWQPQLHTMWLRLSRPMADVCIDDWHISYFDRI